jgi:cell division protein FtsB
MKVDLGIWDKLTRLIIGLLVLATLVGIALWYLPLIQENERRRREILQKDAEIQKELQLSNRLKAEIEAFRNPRTVERLARQQLNYARTGETVIRFEEPRTNRSPAAPAR